MLFLSKNQLIILLKKMIQITLIIWLYSWGSDRKERFYIDASSDYTFLSTANFLKHYENKMVNYKISCWNEHTASKKSKWSAIVTETSNAMNLDKDVFKSKDSEKIARSLKRSAEHSKCKKAGPFQSAMSMLDFYINQAGKNLSRKEKEPLEKAKTKLRRLFHKPE